MLFHPSLGELLGDESGYELAGPAGYTCVTEHWLVVWTMNFMTFHSVGKKIIPTDELHHFSEGWVYQPPTRLLLTIINHIITIILSIINST